MITLFDTLELGLVLVILSTLLHFTDAGNGKNSGGKDIEQKHIRNSIFQQSGRIAEGKTTTMWEVISGEYLML